jgi:hypothetical protein
MSKPNDISLAVTDGNEFIGRVVLHDGSYFAIRPDGSQLGEFATQREAVCALPKASS